jgi:hypothetical protein
VVYASRCEGRPNKPATGLRFLTYKGSLATAGSAPRTANMTATFRVRTIRQPTSKPLKINVTLNQHLLRHEGAEQLAVTGSTPVTRRVIVGEMKTP